jgi:peptidoglycan-associated lipoprotein
MEGSMKRILLLVLILGFAVISFGCSKKKVVKPEDAAIPSEQMEQQTTVPARDTDQNSRWIRPKEHVSEQDLALIQPEEGISKYKEEKVIFDDIYFDYDQYDIGADAESTIQDIASWLLKNMSSNVIIEGHCDDRGTNEYNLALGDRRAKAVRDYLTALGIAANRIETLSYGEEQPVCTEASEACWAKNRRAHFIMVR